MNYDQIIKTEEDLIKLFRDVKYHMEPDKCYEITIKETTKKRTITQNNALHQYCKMLAVALNEAGYTMEVVLAHHPHIQWTKESVKSHLWKPVQAGMEEDKKQEEVSTTELSTVTVSDVYLELHNFLAEKYGINVEWPSKR